MVQCRQRYGLRHKEGGRGLRLEPRCRFCCLVRHGWGSICGYGCGAIAQSFRCVATARSPRWHPTIATMAVQCGCVMRYICRCSSCGFMLCLKRVYPSNSLDAAAFAVRLPVWWWLSYMPFFSRFGRQSLSPLHTHILAYSSSVTMPPGIDW